MAINEDKRDSGTAPSKRVKSLLGFDAHFWEQWMLGSLAVVGVTGVAVALFTAAVVISQRRENAETKAEFERYKLETGETIAKANERAAEANLKALRLEARMAPRSIPQAEQEKLTAALKGFDKQIGTIKASPSLPESEMFARILAAPLRAAGWDITPVPGDNSNPTIFPAGVIVWYATEWSAKNQWVPTKSPAAEKLVELLKGLEIDATALPQLNPPMQPPTTMQIVVSTK